MYPRRDATEYRISVREFGTNDYQYYSALLSNTLCADQRYCKDHLKKSILASRIGYRMLGGNEIESGIGTGGVSAVLKEDVVDPHKLRYFILRYGIDRFELLHEESFLIWEFIAAIPANAGELFRQLGYLHRRGFIEFAPDITSYIRDSSGYQDFLSKRLEMADSKRATILDYVQRYEDSDSSPIETSYNDRREDMSALKKPVFIVHGRNEGQADTIARFIEKLGLGAIILQEEASRGRTIIEKVEEYSDVGFAIVILSPDDQGRLGGEGQLKNRARQNVVFEFGFLMGKLGRDKVAPVLISNNNFDKPSDIEGIVYVLLDSQGGWKTKIAKELKAAGYAVDFNKII